MRNKFFANNPSRSEGIERLHSVDQLTAQLKSHKLTDEEYVKIKHAIGRDPSMTELGVFSAMWSEHCSYKSSRRHLRRFPTDGPQVVVGPGENAGVVRLDGKTCIAFKMESHNHPSFIEPYQGAATGVGGILRDVFCMGARPIANLNCLRYGEKDAPRMKSLLENSVKGIGDYGNCVGIPTVGGNISFDSSYNGNILINAMSVGLIHEDEIFKGYASGSGNLVVYVGSATGRDGVHGATMASDSFSSTSGGSRTTVQVGDPFAEKLLLEITLELLQKNLVVGLQDMGAAGLTSSSFEMASRAGSGLFIDLGCIPIRANNLTAYEMLLSESQERMLLVVTPQNWDEVKKIVEHWELSYAIIGEVTDTGRVEIGLNSVLEVDLPVGPVVDDAPLYDRPRAGRPIKFSLTQSEPKLPVDPETHLLDILALSGSKRWLYEQYDQDIGGCTRYSSREGGAAVVAVRPEWDIDSVNAIGISTACIERYCSIDSFNGAALSVLKCARMLAAAGAKPLAITDCLNFGSATDPVVMQQISDAIDGISEACKRLEIPVISGNVSLYNQTDGRNIHPTPMIGMVGRISDYRDSKPAVIDATFGAIYLLRPIDLMPSFAGSISQKILGKRFHSVSGIPKFSFESEAESMDFIARLGSDQNVVACRDIGDGGLISTLTKMLRKFELGTNIDASIFKGLANLDCAFFGEISGAYLIATRENWPVSAKLCHNSLDMIGKFSSQFENITFGGNTVAKSEAFSTFDGALRFVE